MKNATVLTILAFILIISCNKGREKLPIDIVSNLVAYYPCNSNTDDVSGNNNHAEGINLIPTEDIKGNANEAYSLTDSSYIKFPDVINIFKDEVWTYSLWINIDSLNEYVQILLGLDYSKYYGWPQDIPFYFGSISETLFSYDGATHKGNMMLTLNSWHHVVMVYSSNRAYIYLDKVLILFIGSLNFDDQESVNSYYLSGVKYDDKSATFYGKVDEIRFYSRALHEGEINTLFSDYKN